MDNFELLTMNMLGVCLQAWNFKSIRDMIIKDHVSEDDMIALLKHHGPHEPDEYIDDAVSDLCREILPLLYRIKKWYRLIGFIYGMGYGAETIDPLCGSRNPLAFGAAEHNPEFVKAFIHGQKRFNYLTFDGERKCEDGQFRTLPEELVFIDCVEVVEQCIEHGMNPNAFGFHGDRLLDVARSEEMRGLLLAHGATNATTQERNLVWATNELRHERLRRNTMNAFFSTEPLLKLCYFNGNTTSSREQKCDIFFEAALACHAELLEELHPIIELIDCACWTFSFLDLTPINIQLRVFTALWEIGGCPNGDIVIQALQKLAEEHPTTALDMFISRVKSANEEE